MEKELVGLADAARRLGHAPNTVWRWSRNSDFPAPAAKIAGRKVWRFAEIEAWARSRPTRGRPKREDS